jgi:hypothetical protein
MEGNGSGKSRRVQLKNPRRHQNPVILRLPQPLSERSEREAAEDGEGSRTTLPLPDALLGAGAIGFVR